MTQDTRSSKSSNSSRTGRILCGRNSRSIYTAPSDHHRLGAGNRGHLVESSPPLMAIRGRYETPLSAKRLPAGRQRGRHGSVLTGKRPTGSRQYPLRLDQHGIACLSQCLLYLAGQATSLRARAASGLVTVFAARWLAANRLRHSLDITSIASATAASNGICRPARHEFRNSSSPNASRHPIDQLSLIVRHPARMHQERAERHLQRRRQPFQATPAGEHNRAPFEPRHLGLGGAPPDPLGQLFLGQPQLPASFAHVVPESVVGHKASLPQWCAGASSSPMVIGGRIQTTQLTIVHMLGHRDAGIFEYRRNYDWSVTSR